MTEFLDRVDHLNEVGEEQAVESSGDPLSYHLQVAEKKMREWLRKSRPTDE